MPVTVPAGFYVSKLKQGVDYGIYKSSAATAALASTTSLLGFATSPLVTRFPAGSSAFTPLATTSRSDRFAADSASGRSMCRENHASTGLVAVTIAATAQRDSTSDVVLLQADLVNLRKGIEYELTACP